MEARITFTVILFSPPSPNPLHFFSYLFRGQLRGKEIRENRLFSDRENVHPAIILNNTIPIDNDKTRHTKLTTNPEPSVFLFLSETLMISLELT